MHVPTKDCALLNECVTAVPLFPPDVVVAYRVRKKDRLSCCVFFRFNSFFDEYICAVCRELYKTFWCARVCVCPA